MDAKDLLSQDAPIIPTKSLAVSTASAVDLATSMAPFARRLYIGGAGNIRVKMMQDTSFTVYAVQAGQYLTGAFKAIDSTANGTTATGIVAEQ